CFGRDPGRLRSAADVPGYNPGYDSDREKRQCVIGAPADEPEPLAAIAAAVRRSQPRSVRPVVRSVQQRPAYVETSASRTLGEHNHPLMAGSEYPIAEVGPIRIDKPREHSRGK